MRNTPILLSVALLSLVIKSPLSSAENVRSGMNALLSAFRGIQPYIVDQDSFTDPDNSDEVSELVQELRSNFHTLERIPSRYQTLPGFKEHLGMVTDLLDDTARRFDEGKTSYAWWRLRKLPTDCFGCHATYKVSHQYSNEGVIDQSLDPLNQARFMVATRQFSSAQAKFLEVLRDPEYRLNYDEVLRSILLINTRVSKNPREGIKVLQQALATPGIPEEDVREAETWIRELHKWSQERKGAPRDPLAFAEKLITMGSASTPDANQNDVALLRGTAILHEHMETGSLSKEKRARTLYLLGFAYTRLPLFFAEDWAEMYLERCIREFPGTADAKQAYKVYREHLMDEYTGTSGTHMPDDVKLHLEELRRKAFGEHGFGGAVLHRTHAGSSRPSS